MFGSKRIKRLETKVRELEGLVNMLRGDVIGPCSLSQRVHTLELSARPFVLVPEDHKRLPDSMRARVEVGVRDMLTGLMNHIGVKMEAYAPHSGGVGLTSHAIDSQGNRWTYGSTTKP